MKANELRIGNWIYDDEGIKSKVIGFKPFDHSVRCDEAEGCEILVDIYQEDGTVLSGWEVDYPTCKPIPLTDEWLLKFGFKPHGGFYNLNAFDIEVIGDFEYLSFSIIDSAYDFTLKYVHQLQNLYFALTGEELTFDK